MGVVSKIANQNSEIKSSSTPFILTLDIGTSSLRATLFDAQAHTVPGAEHQIKYDMQTTPDGGVQGDADAMFDRACEAIDRVLAQAGESAGRIGAVASDQLVSNILGVGADGRAVTPFYTYADTRCAREVDGLRSRLDEGATHQRVGTRFHTSYQPARFLWLARTQPDLFARARWWMSLGEYLYLRWLDRRACSYSTASWTGMLNRRTLSWDQELLAALPVKADQLSPLVDASEPLSGLRAEYRTRWPSLQGAVWFAAIGDGAAANIGSGCVDTTRIALTVGTSSALRVAIESGKGAQGAGVGGEVPPGLWSYRVERDRELIGGALSEGGMLYEWMRETLQLGTDGAAIENQLAALPPDAHGLTVLPFLAGERAPGWVADARATILGLSLNTRPIDILRAGMEGVAYRLDLIFELLRGAAPDANQVIASGGALARSAVWVQIIADVLGVPVIVSAETEATSRGVALLALKSLGIIGSLGDRPAALGAVHVPDASRHAVYASAVKRQQTWYNSVVKPAANRDPHLRDT